MTNPIHAVARPSMPLTTALESTHALGRTTSFLPNELLLRIFSFLDISALCQGSLVNKKWHQISLHRMLWQNLFEKIEIPCVKKLQDSGRGDWIYRDLSLKFMQYARVDMAFAAAEKCAKIDPHNGAYCFRDLCHKACDMKEYERAFQYQLLAQRFCADAGANALCYYITTQVTELEFLQQPQRIISLALSLSQENPSYGLQALLAIAKKFANQNMFEEALFYTEKAEEINRRFRGSKILENIPHPFIEMGYYMLHLKQYELAEVCAKRIYKLHAHPGHLYADIIIQQLQEENVLNQHLIQQLTPGMLHWIKAYESIALILLDRGKSEEALLFAQARLKMGFYMDQDTFKRELEEKLEPLKLSLSTWLYSSFKSKI